MKTLISSFDYLSQSETLRIGGSRKYQSSIGGCLSFLLFGGICYAILNAFIEYYSRDNFYVASKFGTENSAFFSMKNKELEFFFTLEYDNGTKINLNTLENFKNYFSLNAYFVKKTLKKNIIKTDSTSNIQELGSLNYSISNNILIGKGNINNNYTKKESGLNSNTLSALISDKIDFYEEEDFIVEENKSELNIENCNFLYSKNQEINFPIYKYYCLSAPEVLEDLNIGGIDLESENFFQYQYENYTSKILYLYITKCENKTLIEDNAGIRRSEAGYRILTNSSDLIKNSIADKTNQTQQDLINIDSSYATNAFCSPNEELENFLKNLNIKIYASSYSIDNTNYENPIGKMYEFINEKINAKNQLNLSFKYKTLIYQSDYNIVFDSTLKFQAPVLENIKINYSENFLSRKILNLEIKSSGNEQYLYRRYQKLSQIVVFIGGILKAFKFFGFLLYYFFYKAFRIMDQIIIHHPESLDSYLKIQFLKMKKNTFNYSNHSNIMRRNSSNFIYNVGLEKNQNKKNDCNNDYIINDNLNLFSLDLQEIRKKNYSSNKNLSIKNNKIVNYQNSNSVNFENSRFPLFDDDKQNYLNLYRENKPYKASISNSIKNNNKNDNQDKITNTNFSPQRHSQLNDNSELRYFYKSQLRNQEMLLADKSIKESRYQICNNNDKFNYYINRFIGNYIGNNNTGKKITTKQENLNPYDNNFLDSYNDKNYMKDEKLKNHTSKALIKINNSDNQENTKSPVEKFKHRSTKAMKKIDLQHLGQQGKSPNKPTLAYKGLNSLPVRDNFEFQSENKRQLKPNLVVNNNSKETDGFKNKIKNIPNKFSSRADFSNYLQLQHREEPSFIMQENTRDINYIKKFQLFANSSRNNDSPLNIDLKQNAIQAKKRFQTTTNQIRENNNFITNIKHDVGYHSKSNNFLGKISDKDNNDIKNSSFNTMNKSLFSNKKYDVDDQSEILNNNELQADDLQKKKTYFNYDFIENEKESGIHLTKIIALEFNTQKQKSNHNEDKNHKNSKENKINNSGTSNNDNNNNNNNNNSACTIAKVKEKDYDYNLNKDCIKQNIDQSQSYNSNQNLNNSFSNNFIPSNTRADTRNIIVNHQSNKNKNANNMLNHFSVDKNYLIKKNIESRDNSILENVEIPGVKICLKKDISKINNQHQVSSVRTKEKEKEKILLEKFNNSEHNSHILTIPNQQIDVVPLMKNNFLDIHPSHCFNNGIANNSNHKINISNNKSSRSSKDLEQINYFNFTNIDKNPGVYSKTKKSIKKIKSIGNPHNPKNSPTNVTTYKDYNKADDKSQRSQTSQRPDEGSNEDLKLIQDYFNKYANKRKYNAESLKSRNYCTVEGKYKLKILSSPASSRKKNFDLKSNSKNSNSSHKQKNQINANNNDMIDLSINKNSSFFTKKFQPDNQINFTDKSFKLERNIFTKKKSRAFSNNNDITSNDLVDFNNLKYFNNNLLSNNFNSNCLANTKNAIDENKIKLSSAFNIDDMRYRSNNKNDNNNQSDLAFKRVKTKKLKNLSYSFREFKQKFLKEKFGIKDLFTYWCSNKKNNLLKTIFANKQSFLDKVLSVESISKMHFDIQFLKILLLDKSKISLINKFYNSSIFENNKFVTNINQYIYEEAMDSIETLFFNNLEDRAKILRNLINIS